MYWPVNVIGTLQLSWCGSFSVYNKNKKLGYTVEIARVSGHYAVQGHSRLLILISVENQYATITELY